MILKDYSGTLSPSMATGLVYGTCKFFCRTSFRPLKEIYLMHLICLFFPNIEKGSYDVFLLHWILLTLVCCHVTRFPSIQTRDGRCSNLQSVATDPAINMGDELCNAVDLAKKALSASKQAASLSDSKLPRTGFDGSVFPRSVSSLVYYLAGLSSRC